MRRFLAALIALCIWASPAFAAPARVQGAENSTGFAASVAATLGAGVTSGNALALMVVTTGGLPVMTDNGQAGSATYTLITTSAAQGGFTAYTFYALNVTHAPTIITATPASSGQIYLVVDEASGIATSSALDGSGAINDQASAPSSTDGVTSGSITTGTNGDFIWGATFNATGLSVTQGTGYTAGTNLGGFTFFGSEWKVQASAGAVAATFTNGTASVATITGIFALKPPGAGSTLPPQRASAGVGQ